MIVRMNAMLRSMLTMRPLPRSRVVFAARSGLCMGVPVLAGWLAGDLQAGMMAATGGFTALYGRGRPYRSRAVELALIALAFTLVVAIGNAVSDIAWAVVPTIAVIAMVSTWLGNALRIGPPGARRAHARWARRRSTMRGMRWWGSSLPTRVPVPDGLPGFLEKETAGLGHALESVDA